MSDRLPWYKRFPVEHLLSAADLSIEEDGALARMRDWHWINGTLPSSPAEIAKLIRAPRKAALVDTLLCRFFLLTDDGYLDPELEKQRAHALSKQSKRSVAGTLGADVRWHGKRIANAIDDSCSLLPYARSKISKGEICTDQENSTGLRLRPVGGES